MMTFRKILAASSGRAVRAYFTENTPHPDLDLRCERGRRADPGGRLTSYYTGRDSRAHWRVDMPMVVADALGVDAGRAPKDRELDHLFEGKHAQTGEQWTRHRRKNSAIDFTFAPHKSVSLAIEFAGTEAEAARLWTTLDRANDRMMRFVASDLGWARAGHDGADGAEPGAVGWVSFRHHQARPTHHVRDGKDGITYLAELACAGDPHAHIHNPLFNLVVTPDGRVGSLDTQRLTGTRALVYGAYAQAVMAQELRAMGVRGRMDAKGEAWVLSAIPQAANDLFSKGKKQTERKARAFAKAQGLVWEELSAERKFGLMGAAAQHERLAKAARTGVKAERMSDRQGWRAQAAGIGWSHSTVMDGVTYSPMTREQRAEAAYAFAAPRIAEEFRTAAVIDRDMLALWAARGHIAVGIDGPEDIERTTRLIEARGIELDGKRVSLIHGAVDGKVRVTNSEQVRIERRVAELARAASADLSGALDPAAITAAVARSRHDFDNDHGRAQVAAMHALGTGGGLSFLTGVAGSGKSTLLSPLVDAWRADTRFDARGREVVGVATGWVQADAMQDAGIDQTWAMDPFLRMIAAGEYRPGRNTVIVVEELSQIGPKSFLRLLELQAEIGCTIKAIGDREQCSAIEPGDTIEILNRVLPKGDRPELRSTVRQKTDKGKHIAGLFRDGGGAEAIQIKRRDGTARLLGGDAGEVCGQIADFYIRRRDVLLASGFRKGITASALTNADAADVSAAIRERLKLRGEIAGRDVVYRAQDQRGERYDLPLAVGDRTRLFRRTWGVVAGKNAVVGSNGHVVTVRGIGDRGLTVQTRDGRVAEIEWRNLKAPHSDRLLLGYGWCQTVDAIQGATSDEHINALPRGTAGLTKFRGYTAESRAEWDTWTLIGEAAVFEAMRHKRALGDDAPITTDHLWKQVGQDFTRAPYKPLGMDLLETALSAEAAAVDRFIEGAQRIEEQRGSGRIHALEYRERLQIDGARRGLARDMAALATAMDANRDREEPSQVVAPGLRFSPINAAITRASPPGPSASP